LLLTSQLIRQRVRDEKPGLLIELPAGPDEVNALIEATARALPQTYDGSRVHAPALAFVAVHIAANADSSVEGFRPLFYERLHFSGDWTSRWQYLHGPAIRQFLEAYFPDVELPEPGKPFAFVGAVNRHCGVPPSARGELAALLGNLIVRHKWHFSPGDLRTAASTIESAILREFLESDTGTEFCRSICSRAALVLSGELADRDIPEYRRNLVTNLVQLLRGRRDAPEYIPEPVVEINVERRVIEVCFNVRSRDTAYCDQSGNPIREPRLRIEDCPDVVLIGCGSRPVRWRLADSWDRKSGGTARFRFGSGKLVGRGRPTSGFAHYTLVQETETRPSSDRIHVAPMRFRDDPCIWQLYRSEGTLGGSSVSAALTLAWKATKADPDLPRGIFSPPLPQMIVQNWRPEAESSFRVVLRDSRKAQVLAIDRGSIVFPDEIAPGPCEVRLERRTASDDECIDRRPFVLLPAPSHVAFVESLVAGGDTVHLHCVTPEDWQVQLTPANRRLRTGLYEFQGAVWSVEVGYRKDDTRFRINLPCPRVVLSGASGPRNSPDDDVIWMDEVDDIRCAAGTSVLKTIGVVVRTGSDVRTIGTVEPRNGVVVGLSAIDKVGLRGALQEAPLLELWLDADGRLLRSGVFVGSAEYVEEAIGNLGFAFQSAEVPPSFIAWAQQMQAIVIQPQQTAALMTMPRDERLRSLTADLLAGARAFDGATIETAEEAWVPYVSASMWQFVNWRSRAQTIADDYRGDGTALLSEFASLPLHDLIVLRWRENLGQLRDRIESGPAHLLGKLISWREAIENDATGTPSTPFSNLAGSPELVRAAQCYYRAGRAHGANRTSNLLAALGHLEEALNIAEPGDIIDAIGRILKIAVLKRRTNCGSIEGILGRGHFPLALRDIEQALRTLGGAGSFPELLNVGAGIRLNDIVPPWPDDEFQVASHRR
jgi:hypothetical protein